MKNSGQILKIKIGFLLVLSLGLMVPAKAQKKSNNVSVTVSNGTTKYSSSSHTKGNDFKIEYKGDIEITDDDKDIKSISSGGFLEVSNTTFGSKREIIIEAEGGGKLSREYKEGRKTQPWNPDGREWLAEILPDIVRSTGIAAESRVNRFYKEGKANAVLNEMAKLKSDYVIAIYAKLLFKKPDLNDDELIEAVTEISALMDSDYYLAQILQSSSKRFLKNDKTAEAYFETATMISSDYYAAQILKSALDTYKPTASSLKKIMSASEKIGSDYYQAQLLSSVLDIDDLDSELLAQIVKNTKGVGSDYYQTQLLTKALEKDGLPPSAYNSLLDAVSDVSSDYYMASVFSKLADKPLDDEVVSKIVSLVNEKMSSDYYSASVLSKVMHDQPINDVSMDVIAKSVGNIHSGHYASSVIASASNKSNLTKENLLSLIKAINNIDSDYYAASALEAIAPIVKKSDSEVKEAYRLAAKNIHSDTYYGKAMRAID